MMDTLSNNGAFYKVRSCTELHGVIVQVWFPKDPALDRILRKMVAQIEPGAVAQMDHHLARNEPHMELFIPGDIKDALGRAIIETACDVPEDDDPMMSLESNP